jgi:signal transduction histidine kinase
MDKLGAEDINITRLKSLAKSSVEIQQSRTEADVMHAVLVALAESGFREAILSLIDGNSSRIVGHVASGSRWQQVLDMTNRHLGSDDILAIVVRTRQAVFIPDSRNDPRCEMDLVRRADIRAQYVVPLHVANEMIGTLQVHLGDRDALAPDEALLLQAFGAHIALAISRLRSLEETTQLASDVVSSSRFFVAETLLSGAAHGIGHRLRQVINEINHTLKRPDVRENRLLQETLNSWRAQFLEVDRELHSMLGAISSEADPRVTDVANELRHTVEQWMPYFLQHRSSVQSELTASVGECRIGTMALREILSVLLVNAVQAHAKIITIRSSVASEVEVPPGNYILNALCLDVLDDGIGLQSSDSERIFEIGYTTKEGKLGTGLGLFIGRKLARQAGGELAYLEREQGALGAAFRLTLPVIK